MTTTAYYYAATESHDRHGVRWTPLKARTETAAKAEATRELRPGSYAHDSIVLGYDCGENEPDIITTHRRSAHRGAWVTL